METFFVITLSICERRNKRIFEGSMEPPKVAIERALAAHKLYSKCYLASPCDLVKVGYSQPPEDNILKLNINGVVFANLQDAGIGVVLRNSIGKVLMVASLKERNIQRSGNNINPCNFQRHSTLPSPRDISIGE